MADRRSHKLPKEIVEQNAEVINKAAGRLYSNLLRKKRASTIKLKQ